MKHSCKCDEFLYINFGVSISLLQRLSPKGHYIITHAMSQPTQYDLHFTLSVRADTSLYLFVLVTLHLQKDCSIAAMVQSTEARLLVPQT